MREPGWQAAEEDAQTGGVPQNPPHHPPPPAPAGVRRGERAWEEKGLQVRGETSRRERAAGSRLVWGESALYKSEWK